MIALPEGFVESDIFHRPSVYKKFHFPAQWKNKKYKYKVLKDPFKATLLSWLASNYYFLKQTDVSKDKVLTYEKLTGNPTEFREKFEKNTNLNFSINSVNIKKRRDNKYRHYKIIKGIKELDLLKEYNFIINKIGLKI